MTEVDLSPTPTSDLDLDRLRRLTTLQEHRFQSPLPLIGPLIAHLRAAWNSVSTKWYVRPLLRQQSELNELVVAAIAAHDVALCNQTAQLRVLEGRLVEEILRLGELQDRIHDHDTWLIAQDREQSEFVCDLAEIRLLLVQVDRLLQDVNGRMHRLEVGDKPQNLDRVA